MFDWYQQTPFSNQPNDRGVAIAPGGLSEQDVQLLNGFGTPQDAQCASLAMLFPDNPILAMQLRVGAQRAAMCAQPVIDSGLGVFLDQFPLVGELDERIQDEGPTVTLGHLPTGEPLRLPVSRFAGTSLIAGPTNGGKTSCLKYLLWQLMQLNQEQSV